MYLEGQLEGQYALGGGSWIITTALDKSTHNKRTAGGFSKRWPSSRMVLTVNQWADQPQRTQKETEWATFERSPTGSNPHTLPVPIMLRDQLAASLMLLWVALVKGRRAAGKFPLLRRIEYSPFLAAGVSFCRIPYIYHDQTPVVPRGLVVLHTVLVPHL